MYDTAEIDRRTADDYPRERSPSTDWRGVRVVFHITDGEDTHRRAELDPRFAKEYLEVSS